MSAATCLRESPIIPFPASSDGVVDHFSPSSLKDYLSCPQKFFLRRVLKIVKPTPLNCHIGRAVHAGVQAFHLARWREEDESAERIIAAYQLAFDEPEEPVTMENEEARIAARETGERVVRSYLESEEAALIRSPKGVEVRLVDDFPSLPSPLVGIIDLVHQDNTPCDFKTVAATPNVDQEAWQHAFQLTAYQLLIEAATGEPVPALELVFLVKTKASKVIRHRMPPADDRAKARFWAMAEAAVDGIYHERWHPQPGMHCTWCQYRTECANWTGGVL